MKLSTFIIFLSGFTLAKFQWKKQYSKGQEAKSKCKVNIQFESFQVKTIIYFWRKYHLVPELGDYSAT